MSPAPYLGKVNLLKGRITREEEGKCANHIIDQLYGRVEGSLLGVRWGLSDH